MTWSSRVIKRGCAVVVKRALEKLFGAMHRAGLLDDYIVVHSQPLVIDCALKPKAKTSFHFFPVRL